MASPRFSRRSSPRPRDRGSKQFGGRARWLSVHAHRTTEFSAPRASAQAHGTVPVVRHVVPFAFAFAAIGLACGGGMSGAGNPNPNSTANDDGNEAASTASAIAFQTLLAAHLHDACATRSSCGSADAARPPFPRAAADRRDVSWAIDHLTDDDPNDALATLIDAGLAASEPALVPLRTVAFQGKPMPRMLALATLGALGDVGGLDAIERALRDGDPALRAAAASAARMLSAAAAFSSDRLRAAMTNDESFVVRCRLADAMTLTSGTRVTPPWTKADDDLFAIGTPLPTGRCASLAERFCTTMVVEEGEGCLLGLTWGGSGSVAVFAAEDIETYPHGTSIDGAPSDPLQLVTVAGERWIISGGAVHLLTVASAGRLRAVQLAQLASVPTWYRVDGTTLVVQTEDGVVHRVTKRGAR